MTGPRVTPPSRLDQLDQELDALPGAGRSTVVGATVSPRPASALDAVDAELDGVHGSAIPRAWLPTVEDKRKESQQQAMLRLPGAVVMASPPPVPPRTPGVVVTPGPFDGPARGVGRDWGDEPVAGAQAGAVDPIAAGVPDPSKIYTKHGHPVVDTSQRDAAGHVPTHRLDQATNRYPSETWDSYEERVLARQAFSPDTAAHRDLTSLQPDVQRRAADLIAAARASGVQLEPSETLRSQERQEMLFQKGRSQPGGVATWTLTSDHTPGRAVDFVVNGDPSGKDAGYRWLQEHAPRFGFSVLGSMDPGHVALPDSAPPPVTISPEERQRHAALLARNEAGKRRDAEELDALQHPVRATAEAIGDAGRSMLAGLGQLATHPWQLATEPAAHVANVLSAPVVGEVPHDPRLTKGGNPTGRPIRTAPYTVADPGALTPGQLSAEGARAVADVGLLGAGEALPIGLAAAGAAHSETTNPEDVAKSALAMLGGGALLHGVVQGGSAAADALHRAADVSSGMMEAGAKGVEATARAEGQRLGATMRRAPSALDQVAAELDAVKVPEPAPAPASHLDKLHEELDGAIRSPGEATDGEGRPDGAPTPDRGSFGALDAEPPRLPGMVRFYHGGRPYDGGSRWITEDRGQALGYATKYGRTDAALHYVDVPDDHPILQQARKAFDDTGTSQRAPFSDFDAPPEIAARLRPIRATGEPLSGEELRATAEREGPRAQPTAARTPSALDTLYEELTRDAEAPAETPRVMIDEDGVERFRDARTPGGRPRAPEKVHTEGLLEELGQLEQMQRGAEQRGVYRFTPDDNFHTTTDGRSVMGATRRGKGPSEQAKAATNLEAFRRRREAIVTELTRRGLDEHAVWDRLQAMQERRVESEGLREDRRNTAKGDDVVRDEAGNILFARGIDDDATGDLFGEGPPRPRAPQAGLFGEKEGTEAARNLAHAEAAARAELSQLRERHRLTSDAGERQQIAGRIAQLERLTNRGGAIGADELRTRLEAEHEPGRGPDASGQGTFFSRELPNESADVPRLRGDELGGEGTPLHVMRRTAFRRAKAAFLGDVVRNDEQGWDVRIGRDGLQHATSGAEGPYWRQTLHAVQVLPDLIRAGHLTESWEPKAKASMSEAQAADHAREVGMYHHLRTSVEIGGRRYTVEMTLRELSEAHEPHRFYHLKTIDVEPEGAGRAEPGDTTPRGSQRSPAAGPTRDEPPGSTPRNLARDVPARSGPVPPATPETRGGGETPGAALLRRGRGGAPEPADMSLGRVNRYADSLRRLFGPAGRTPEAGMTARVIRERAADMAMRDERAREALKAAAAAFDRVPIPEQLAFIDRMESGQAQPTPALSAAAATIRGLLDSTRDEITALSDGALSHWIENYFPHIWRDPEAARNVIARILSKRELAGPASFLKRRTIPTVRDGIEAGLIPATYNPVDLALLKLHEMNRYVLGMKIMAELKEQNLIKFVGSFEKPPVGMRAIDDRLATVYGPSHVTVKEAFDKLVRDQLEEVMKDLGVTHLRQARIGHGNAAGYAEGDRLIVSRAGGEFSVIEHEIGHILDAKLGLWDRLTKIPGKDRASIEARKTVQSELRALADLRFEGQEATQGYKDYVRKREEKVANAVLALIYAPDRMQAVAPTIKAKLTSILRSDPVAARLLAIKPSLVLGGASHDVSVGGLVIKGKYHAPEPVALVLNNYLSPGLRSNPWYSAYMNTGNLLNQAQLGLSAFHLGFTSMDAAVSKGALAIEQLVSRKPLAAIKSAATVPAAPFTNYLQGDRVLREYLRPGSSGGDMAAIVDALQAAGGRVRMDRLYHADAVSKFFQALREARTAPNGRLGAGVRAAGYSLPALMEAAAKPVMEHVVPRQKLGVFADLARLELSRLPADATRDQVRDVMARAWDSVDNRMGQLVYDNLFWHKATKDLAMASVRSVGWNIGTVREIPGGALDIGRGVRRLIAGERSPGELVSHRAAYVVALPIVAGLAGGVMHYLYTGQPPQTLKDWFYPRTGRVGPDGHEERVQLPSYMRDVLDYVRHPMETIGHKAHPLWSAVIDMLHNQDYFGHQIRNPDDPAVVQAKQEARFLAEQFIPFGVQNAREQHRQGQGVGTMAQNFVGITPAPREVVRTKAEQRMAAFLARRRPTGATPEAVDQQEQRGQAIADLRAGRPGALEQVRAAVRGGELTPRQGLGVVRRAHVPASVAQFQRLTLPEAVEVMQLATPEERQLWTPVLQSKLSRVQPGTLTPQAVERIRAGLRTLQETPR